MIISSKVPFSYIFRKIRYDLIFVVAVAIVINLLAARFQHRIPEMPIHVPTFLGTAISILLSFKISQSYDRWWEARKVWGAIVNDSRSLVLQLQACISGPDDGEQQRAALRQAGWCWCLARSLRGQDPLEGLGDFLSEAELSVVAAHTNKPLAILQQHSAVLARLRKSNQFDGFSYLQLDNTLVRLCDSMGKAERINNTVFPVTYRLFLHFSIYLFVVMLSLALKDVSPLYEVPLLTLISSVFLLLEKSAFHLQDPFRNRPSDVPVFAIARTIEINLRQLAGLKEVPPPLAPTGFYLM